METGYLKQVKAILKSLVLSNPNKITMDQLNRDFREIEGQNIPFQKLGYRSLEQFLRQIPDTLIVAGEFVFFVDNEKSAHIHNMIMEQKKPPRRRRLKPASRYISSAPPPQITMSRPRNNNRFSSANQPRRQSGQQLSSFHITNRNVSTRAATVRDIPQNRTQSNVNASFYAPTNKTGYTCQHQPDNKRPQNRTQSNANTSFYAPTNETYFAGLPQPDNKRSLFNYATAGIQSSNSVNHDIPQNRTQSNVNASFYALTNKTVFGGLPQPDNKRNLFNDAKAAIQNSNAANKTESANVPKDINHEISKQYNKDLQEIENMLARSCHVMQPTRKAVSFLTQNQNESNACNEKLNSAVINSPPTEIKHAKPKVKLSQEVQDLLKERQSRNTNPLQKETAKLQDMEIIKKPEIQENKVNRFKKLFDISDVNLNDVDEAIPEFAANNRVFRIDLPKHTVPYGCKIETYKLPDDIQVNTEMKIFISEIHNPFKFWFHINNDDKDNELDELMHHIERFYGRLSPHDLRIPVACLTPGQVCAASFNGMWHRGEIIAPMVKNKTKISFIDYGTVADVDISEIKYLATAFALLPAQALRGCLSHIKPRGLHWSHEATYAFLDLVSEIMLYAKITEIDRENSVFYMIICDTNCDEVIQINTNLIEQKYAMFNEQWDEDLLKKNNGRRLHHPREDFPTFAMLESGEYPTFGELVHLLELGIDYEIIYDRIIFNHGAIVNFYDCAPEPIKNLPFFLMNTNPFRADIVMELTN